MIFPVTISHRNPGFFADLVNDILPAEIEIFQVHSPTKPTDPCLWVAAKKGIINTSAAFKLSCTIAANPSLGAFKKELAKYLKKC